MLCVRDAKVSLQGIERCLAGGYISELERFAGERLLNGEAGSSGGFCDTSEMPSLTKSSKGSDLREFRDLSRIRAKGSLAEWLPTPTCFHSLESAAFCRTNMLPGFLMMARRVTHHVHIFRSR